MPGQNYFFPGPSDPSFYGFYKGNAEYERQFFGNANDSYLDPATASTILKTLRCSVETETQNSTKARKPRK